MAKLTLQGSIIHVPGIWGVARPAQGVSVSIIDVDVNSADDVIFADVTDVNGAFSGRSREWRDMGRMWDFVNRRWVDVPDATDVLVLKAQLTQGPYSVELPFVYVSDAIPSPPLIVPWGPSNFVFARVNGRECDTLAETANVIYAEVGAGTSPIEIEVYDGVTATIFEAFTSIPLLKDWLNARGIPTGVWGGDDVFLILLGLAILVTATLLALALLYAVYIGYRDIQFEQTIAAPGGGEITQRIRVAR